MATVKELQKKKFEKEHKIVDRVDYKFCNKHYIFFPEEDPWLPSTIEYFYHNDKNTIDGLHPECKECTKKKSIQWEKENPEQRAKINIETNRRRKEYNKQKADEYRQRGGDREWARNNRDKTKQYGLDYKLHKKHNISKEEIQKLYKFCNSTCMYCGISEEEAKKVYNKRLFKDHFMNDGSNGIDNCILCCNGCSSSKGSKMFEDWYTPDKPIYSKRRLNKIMKWLNKFQ